MADDADRRHGPRPSHGSRSRGPMKDSQGRPVPSKEPRSKRANKRLDVIDKLDLTGIYGEGCRSPRCPLAHVLTAVSVPP